MKWMARLKERVDKKRFFLFLVFTVLALVCYQGYLYLGLYLPEQTYLRQFTGLAVAVFGVLAVVNFYKMFRGGLLHTVAETVGKALGKAFSKLSALVNKATSRIRKALGLPEKSRKARGNDERSFIFSSGKNTKKNTAGKDITKLKWKDLTSDSERIRYIFVRFVRKCGKKGYKYSVFSTPLENGSKWKLKEQDGGEIFSVYTDAQYGDGSYEADQEKMKQYAELSGVK